LNELDFHTKEIKKLHE